MNSDRDAFDAAQKRAVRATRQWHAYKDESTRRLAELEVEMVKADREYREAFARLRGDGDG